MLTLDDDFLVRPEHAPRHIKAVIVSLNQYDLQLDGDIDGG